MGIRIQAPDIDVPEENPFENDLLNRKDAVEILTNRIRSFEGPCVLAVDAPWGAGKTTFLRIWAQYLRNNGFPVVEFNAWETDFTGDPVIALSAELTEGLRKYDGETLGLKIDDFKGKSVEFLKRVGPGVAQFAITNIPTVGPALEKLADSIFSSNTEERLNNYTIAKKYIRDLQNALADIAGELSNSRDNRPLVVLIDELDRCRPTYAIELLETAKHLFAVDNVVFVLAINVGEMAHSIKALYGKDFDAEGYLERFISLDFKLPNNVYDANGFTIHIRDGFIKAMLETIQFAPRDDLNGIISLLQFFFRTPDLSIRDIVQAISRLRLVIEAIPSKNRSFIHTVVALLIIRTIDSDLYHRFVRKEVTDIDVVDTVYERVGLQNQPNDSQSHIRAFFERIIIVGPKEKSFFDKKQWESPLLNRYQNLVADTAADEVSKHHASVVIEYVKGWEKQNDSYGAILFNGGLGFDYSVQRLELLSPEFKEEPTESVSS